MMPVHNSDISRVFEQIADFLEIKGDNPFRIRAYREGARTIENLVENAADMVSEGEDLTELPGIGEDLADKIEVIVAEGTHPLLEELKEELPEGLLDILNIESLGPKRVQKIYNELGVENLQQLERAARSGKIKDLEGFGEKTTQKIIKQLQKDRSAADRHLFGKVQEVAEAVKDYLVRKSVVDKVEIAGSYRRKKETVGDLDVLVISDSPEETSDYFVDFEDVEDVIAHGETKSSVVLRGEIQVDLRVVAEKSYGAALHYFTGSKEHNIALRKLAQQEDLKVNEYGVFKGDEQVAGASEEEIYSLFDCQFIEPELRENRGEIEAARNGKLPDLIELEDLRGDLQCHTTASDGANTLQEMGEAARQLGHEYLAVTDHSAHLGVTGGLDEKRVCEQMEKIDEINRSWDDFRLLKSIEVDILADGQLDLADEILAELDIVTAAIHTKFDLPPTEQTERIVSALQNPHVNVLAHPTGRKLLDREGYQFDLDKVIETAAGQNCCLEINSSPQRLDLDDRMAARAREKGVKITISTDAHNTQNLNYLKYGVYQARRAWLEADDVLNTWKWNKIKKYLFGR